MRFLRCSTCGWMNPIPDAVPNYKCAHCGVRLLIDGQVVT